MSKNTLVHIGWYISAKANHRWMRLPHVPAIAAAFANNEKIFVHYGFQSIPFGEEVTGFHSLQPTLFLTNNEAALKSESQTRGVSGLVPCGYLGTVRPSGRGHEFYIPTKYEWLLAKDNLPIGLPSHTIVSTIIEPNGHLIFVFAVTFQVKSIAPEWSTLRLDDPDFYSIQKKKVLRPHKVRNKMRERYPELFAQLPVRRRD